MYCISFLISEIALVVQTSVASLPLMPLPCTRVQFLIILPAQAIPVGLFSQAMQINSFNLP